jgi:hypothetical protein
MSSRFIGKFLMEFVLMIALKLFNEGVPNA